MAESEKKTSSSVSPKEKKSLFDDEIGNEFLGSWKSMSVMDDDKLDFGFDTVSTGKNKAFNFDKLDMDFDLGGDFGKLSSFKVDMSDLDFPDSSKKAAKPKNKSDGESPMGNHQGGKDSFSFSFDFNELDNFDFGSNLEKAKKTSMKSLDADGVLSDRSECQDSKINQAGGSAAFFDDGQTEKPTASESVTTSKVETSLAGGAADCSLNNILPSRSGLNEDVAVSHGARTSTEKSISGTAEETEHQSCSPERTVPSEPYAPQKTQILAVQSVSRNDSTEDIVSNVEIDVGSPSMEVDKESGAEQTVNGRIVDGTKPSHESSQEKNSDTLHLTGSEKKGGESKWTGGEIQTDNTVEAEPMPDDSDTETTSIRSLSGTAPQECNISKDIQDSASKLLVTLASETVADKIVPIKEKESGDVRSKFFSSSKPVPKLHHPSTEGVAVSSSGSKGIYAMQSSHPEIGKRQRLPAIDAHLGRKLVGDSKSPFRELSKGEPALLGIEKNVKTLCNIRESINCDGVQNGCKAVVTPIPPVDKEVPKGNPAGLGSKMNTKDLHNFGCGIIHAGLTDKTTKSNTQTSEKCRIVVSSIASMRNSKIISAEVLKDVKKTPDLSSLKISKSMGSMRNSTIISAEGLKAVKKTPDLYSLKISKSMGENKRPNAIREREISFSRNSEKNMEVNRNNASKIILPVVNAEKKSPLITSLKRKTIEAVNADLVLSNPPKRLSLSPRENRNFKECSESIVEDQVCDNGDRAGSKTSTVFYDHCSGLQRTQELNIKDIDISSAMENDGNVEMAEAFAKELEDICNMLKKKHEEAKELLVRAVVTNNNLLLLNHPMFDEKIRMAEKFAAKLVLK